MTVKVEEQMSLLTWKMLLLLSCLWGCSFLFSELMLMSYPPLWVVFFRLFFGGLAALSVGLFFMRGRGRGRGRRMYVLMWLKLTGQGLLGVGIPFTMITYAQEVLTSGHTAILNATAPLSGMVLSHIFGTGERLVMRKIAGVILGIVGVSLMFGDKFLEGGMSDEVWAQVWVLLAIFCYGMGSVYTRKMGLLEVPVPYLVGVSLLGGSGVIAVAALVWEGFPSRVMLYDVKVLGSGLVLGVLCTGCAYLLFYPILKRAGSNVFLCTLLIPWIALLLGNEVLGESFNVWQILGVVVISMSLLWIDGRLFGGRR